MDARQAQRDLAPPESALPWLIGGHEAPVFVDHSGRRARGVRVVGAAMAALCALWLVGLLLGMAGFSGFPAGRLPIGGLPALARAGLARVELREPASASAAGREVDAVNRRSGSVCPSSSTGAPAPTPVGRSGYATSPKGTGRPACSSKLPVALHRESSRLT